MSAPLLQRIGIDVGRKLRLEDAVAWAAAHGVGIIDVQLDTGDNVVTSFDAARGGAIRDACARHGIQLGLHTLSAVNVAEYAPLVGEAVDAYLKAYIDAAVHLGAGWIVVHAGFHFTADIEMRMRAGLERLQRITAYAETRGVRLLLENLNKEPRDAEVHYLAHTLEEWRWYYDQIDSPAFRLLRQYRDRICTFNDDIQGTASVALAGVYSALRLTKGKLADQRFLFLGAGEAGIGIGELIVEALKSEGVTEAAARRQCWYVDANGLVSASRTDLAAHQKPFAHDQPGSGTLLGEIETLKPTMLIGVSGTPATFTEPVVRAMAKLNALPVIFALSNPTSRAECTAEQAYTWTGGRVVFASGSPFPDVTLNGRTFSPGQSNNSYVFPGVGLGVIVSQSRRVTDEMFFVAAKVLASLVTEQDLAAGRIFPALQRIREVSAAIAVAVARVAFARQLTPAPCPADLPAVVQAEMYEPTYRSYV